MRFGLVIRKIDAPIPSSNSLEPFCILASCRRVFLAVVVSSSIRPESE